MALTRKQTALLHVAKARLGMDDAAYREILRQEAGVDSSTRLDADGFEAVLARFQALGFEPPARAAGFGRRLNMASDRQVAYIRDLWSEYTDGEGDDASLGKWLEHTVKVSDIRFVGYRQASRAITGLLAMRRKKAARADREANDQSR